MLGETELSSLRCRTSLLKETVLTNRGRRQNQELQREF